MLTCENYPLEQNNEGQTRFVWSRVIFPEGTHPLVSTMTFRVGE